MSARVFNIPAVVALLFSVAIVLTIVVSLASESERPETQEPTPQEPTPQEPTVPKSSPLDRQLTVRSKRVAPADQLVSSNEGRAQEPVAVPERRQNRTGTSADSPPQAGHPPRRSDAIVRPLPASDAKILLLEGKFPVRDILRLYSDLSGLPVLFDAGDTILLNREIEVVTPIRDIDEEMINELLRSNRIFLRKKRLGDGRMVVRVRSEEASTVSTDPEPIPIIRVER